MKSYDFEGLLEIIKQRCVNEPEPGAAMYDAVGILRWGLKLTKASSGFVGTLINITTPGYEELSLQDRDKMLALLKLKKKPVIADEEKNKTEKEILEKLGIEILWPFFSQTHQKEVIGFLALGQKQNGHEFSYEELEFLKKIEPFLLPHIRDAARFAEQLKKKL